MGQEFSSAPVFFSQEIVGSGGIKFLNFRSDFVDLRKKERFFQKGKIRGNVIFLLQFGKEEFNWE
jgi:hypothetical protein